MSDTDREFLKKRKRKSFKLFLFFSTTKLCFQMNIDDQLSTLISSAYQVLTPMDTVCHTIMNNSEQNMMIYRIRSILNDQLDEAQQYKDIFHRNAMQPILFDVLSEIKQRNNLNLRQISIGNDAYDQELARLDAILIAERIIEPYPNELSDSNNNSSIDTEHPDYQMNLARIRQFYHEEFDKFTKNSNDFCTHVVTLLQQQSQIRPISNEEMTQMISIVRNKLCLIQIQLKQYTCEAVINLRRKYLDAK